MASTFIFQQVGFAQIAAELNISAYLGRMQNSFIQERFRLPHLRYFSYDNATNSMRVLLDKGDLKDLKGLPLEDSARSLLTYFLIGVTLPDENFWVNLRPDAEDNIITPELAKTDIGKILLETDLQLKKDTAQFTSPQTPEGTLYWDKLYKKAGELFGSENISIPTLTRPWIVPDEIIVRETKDSAYVYKATLKVLLEQDYLKDSATYNFKDPRLKALNEYSSQLIRELIIPKLTKEVNNAKRYAALRQVYYSLILARWFKARFYGKGGLYSWNINKADLTGLTSSKPWSKTTYFKEYQKSFKEGEYNLQAPVSGAFGQSIRSYFSGGGDLTGIRINFTAMKSTENSIGAFTVAGNGNTRDLPGLFTRGAGLELFVGTGVSDLRRSSSPIKAPVVSSPAAIDEKATLTTLEKWGVIKRVSGGMQVITNWDPAKSYTPLFSSTQSETQAIQQAREVIRRFTLAEMKEVILSRSDLSRNDLFVYLDALRGSPTWNSAITDKDIDTLIAWIHTKLSGYIMLAALPAVIVADKHFEGLSAVIAGLKDWEDRVGPTGSSPATLTKDLKEFKKIGQQIYLDGVTWEQIVSGEFEKLVKEQGINGVTTNPPLIKKYLESKAVQKKANELGKQFAAQGFSREEVQAKVYRELIAGLAVTTIEILRKYSEDPTFSIEIDPTRADDVEASVKEAMEWLDILDTKDTEDVKYRNYIMLKVLANEKGYEIIEEITALGGNVNATLILTPQQLDKVAVAFIKGLERAVAAGIDISKIRAAMSFFPSRWDVKLAPDLSEEQQGKVANAVTTVAYHEAFLKWFNSERFKALQAKGARKPMFIEGSTGSKADKIAQVLKKNPGPEYKGKDVDAIVAKAYPYDIYVSPLQGQDVTNTLPFDTIKELMDKGFVPEVTIAREENYTAAKQVLKDVQERNRKDINLVGKVLLQEGLAAFIDDYLDVQRTIAGIVSYPAFRDGVNNYIDTNPVGHYPPLPGTPALRQAVAQLINAEILDAQGMQISSGNVTISLGTTGLLELLTSIFCDIENAPLKKQGQKDTVALSPHAKPLYNPKTAFARTVDLKAEKPRMMVIDSWDIEAGKLEELLAQAYKNNTLVVFLDNDSYHKNISEVYKLLSQNEKYRENTIIVTDISRRFGLAEYKAEYNVGAFVTFNKAILDAMNAATGGSIAGVSRQCQAGFAKLIGWQLSKAKESQGAKLTIAAVENKSWINDTYRTMEPDPTLAISPTGMLDKYQLPEIFLGRDFPAFRETLNAVIGAQEVQSKFWDYLVSQQGQIPISTYEAAFNKAAGLGIVKKLETAYSEYTEALFAQYASQREALLSKILDEPNPQIVEILRDAYKNGQLNTTEIIQMWVVFNIEKMHVGEPGYERDEETNAALRLPEERLTAEQIKEMDEIGLPDAGVFFAKDVFNLSLGREHVASGFCGSKSVLQRALIGEQVIDGIEVGVVVNKTFYVGYGSSIKGAGIPQRNTSFYDTKSDNDWVPTAVETKEAFDKLSPSIKKVLILTVPDNPSGAVVPAETMEDLLELVVRNDAFMIIDVAYGRLLFYGIEPTNLGRVCENVFNRLDPGLKQRKGVNKAGDLTKYFALMQTQSKEIVHPDARLGAAISGDARLIKYMRDNMILEADPVAKKAQVALYGPQGKEHSDVFIKAHREYLERSLNHICEVFDRLGIHYKRPRGAFYILFRIGEGPYIRFAFPGSFANIIQVMARIERLYPKWKTKEVFTYEKLFKEVFIFTYEDLFKEAAVTSVPGGAFGAPESKAEEDAINARQITGVDVKAEPITWKDHTEFAKLMRYRIFRALYEAGSGHLNTSLSDVEINMALYALGGMHYDSRDPKWNLRDRFVTKGHSYTGLYSILAQMGFFSTADLEQLRSLGQHLSGHVTVDTPGVDANTGILGQSLSIALGEAINAILEGTNYTTFCNIGDGETQESQIYAAAETAAFLTKQAKMGKLIAFLDWNKAQRDGWTADHGTVNVKGKWEALGWQVLEVDGHDPFAIKAAIDQAKTVKDKPTAIICVTQKGKGVSFVSEGDKAWERHGTPPKNAAEYFQGLKEILGVDVARQKIQVGNTELEIDNQEETLAQLFNMPRINRLVEEVQRQNREYRQNLEAELAKQEPNPHLQPTDWKWDGQLTKQYQPGTAKPTRQAAGEFFEQLLQNNPGLRDRFVFLTMDLKESQVLHRVTLEFPQTDYEMGIREDVTASVATGISLASQGRIIPVVGTFAAFLLNMGAQLRIAQQTPGVKFLVYMSHADGLDTGADGSTHQAIEATLLALLLNLHVFMPADANRMWDVLNFNVHSLINDENAGVIFVGGVRGTNLSSNVYDLQLPDPKVDSFLLWESKGIDEANKPDGIIVATGPAMVNLSTLAAKKLDAEGRKIRVICVENLDAIRKEDSPFLQLVEPGVPIVAANDALRHTLGDLVSGVLSRLPPSWGPKPQVEPVGIHAIPATHERVKGISYRGERGEALAAYALYGMDPDGIANTMRGMIQARAKAQPPASSPVTEADLKIGVMTYSKVIAGKETIRLDVVLNGQARGHFVVPAGTSTGEDEAKTVGVDQAITNLISIHNKVTTQGLRADQLVEIAQLMLEMDKDKLGAEATLSYQMALAWAASRQMGLEPYEFIRQLAPDLASIGVPKTRVQYNITNGGQHATNSLDMQEFMVVPTGQNTAESNKMCDNIDRQLGLIYQGLGLKADPNDKGVGSLRGKEGGYKIEDLTIERLQQIYANAEGYNIPYLDIVALRNAGVGVHEFVLNCQIAAIKTASYAPSTSKKARTVALALDPAATSMLVEGRDNLYNYEGRQITSQELVGIYAGWANKYPIESIEDGLGENDWDGWMDIVAALGDKVLLIGDDNLVTQAGRLLKFIEKLKERGFIGPDGKVTKKIGILIKLNQNGFLTTGINDFAKGYLGTLEVIRLAKQYGLEWVVSHRSNEAAAEEKEVSIAEVAAGTNAYGLKSGDHVQAVRAVKEDRLAAIDARERGLAASSPAVIDEHTLEAKETARILTIAMRPRISEWEDIAAWYMEPLVEVFLRTLNRAPSVEEAKAFYDIIKPHSEKGSYDGGHRLAYAQEEALKFVRGVSSSPLRPGGIDFRQLPIAAKPLGSFSGLDFSLPKVANLERIDLNNEFRQIEVMVERGIVPSGARIKEYVAACYQKKELSSRADDLLLCLARVFKLEEENAKASDPELKESLVIVDSL
jgi:transketolase